MQDIDILKEISSRLDRIATALETGRTGRRDEPLALGATTGFLWQAEDRQLLAVPQISYVPLDLLKGLEDVLPPLYDNTLHFARGHGANNVLLWGARGMGKSSLVKAVHAQINARDDAGQAPLVLVEINREDLDSLPVLLRMIAPIDRRFILFCDDLSFDRDETSYKSLKTVLDGGIEGRPDNVLFYATSNRRHLMARDMIDNERSTAINPSEAVEEKVSLSDRFGLWLGFHNCNQDVFLEMVRGYVAHYEIPVVDEELTRRAISWAQLRGSRSGRVAIQLVRQLAGEAGISI